MKYHILLPVVALAASAAYGATPKRPNIIYIMSDDHAQAAISAYDGRLNKTPGLDRIAKEGVRFSESFVANSISGPSRACLLTGKHSHANGFKDNESAKFDSTQQTFPKLLQAAGYTTAVIGKWHLMSDPTGFDHWEILPGQGCYVNPDFYSTADHKLTRHHGYATQIITDKGIEWIESQRNSDKPFCLLLHHKAVHRNWISDSANMELNEDRELPVPHNFFDNYEGRPAAAAQKMSVANDLDLTYDLKIHHPSIKSPIGHWDNELPRMDSTQKAIWDKTYGRIIADYIASTPAAGRDHALWSYQRYIRDYLKCVAALDDNIVRLMDYLDRNGLLENTVVIYASDQGFYLGEHGWYDKRFMYEESMRTPLMVRLPDSNNDVPRGALVNGMVQNIDYAPTILELCGVEVPSDVQGQSFVPLIQGNEPKDWREDGLYYHYYEYPGAHSVRRHEGVRTAQYKLMHFYGHDIDRWELYDLQSDQHEMHNLYGNKHYSKIQKQMHQKLDRLKTKYAVQ